MKFTPEQVVARYRELGARAITGSTNVNRIGGVWKLFSSGCCAMGVMLADQTSTPSDLIQNIKDLLDVNYGSFYVGFDGVDPAGYRKDVYWVEEDYELGKACRQAVTEAGLWAPGYPNV